MEWIHAASSRRSEYRPGEADPRRREKQREIILLLLKHGARPTDGDTSGKSVAERVAGRTGF
jgi:hypothetical protein